LPKGVAFLPRYATVSAAANHRYLDALAIVDDPPPLTVPSTASCSQCEMPRPIVACLQPRDHPRPHPLFAAVLRGEHTLYGFRNRDVRTRLFGPPAAADRRSSAQVSRLVKRLHLRSLVAKIPAPAAGASPSSATPS